MALRLRRDVQKASYYVWFLGAEEAKGLRGTRVINSVLPYLIDRSRGQEPLKVTLQVSHKGIKILQGSSKHFIPHSAITSSVQNDDIVACVLLLYNPATKCPLHVHAYRCDSESTAEALHQQLQVLINRPENQKRFEELETRLGILPPLPTSSNKSSSHISSEHSQKQQLKQPQPQQPPHHFQSQKQPQRRHEASPKRFSSSLGSDTGNSTRESECSEEHSGGSPLSRSPPISNKPLPLPQPNNELFDSLAAELRAKLNGNGPPLLLPPRDYDTVHRSKGNLTAIELRRCRNALIVGGATPTSPQTATAANGKQVSSRGSSGIGSDLAPSPERQELNSSSEDEQWSNEADNSVIALKPSQIPIERAAPVIARHPQLNRKSAMQPPEDSYLRDLPAKPYTPRQGNVRDKVAPPGERELRSKTPSTTSWSREDEIKPIIMRPADYDAKFNRVLAAEQKQDYRRHDEGISRDHAKLRDTDKYNEINRLLNKKLSLERDTPDQPHYKHKHKVEDAEDFDDSDPSSDQLPIHPPSSYRKGNLTDKQKFMEYSSKKQSNKSFAAEEAQKYGGRHRYVDPADLPFEQPPTGRNKYAAVHRTNLSPDRSDLGHRTDERDSQPRRRSPDRERERDRDRKQFSQSKERNPYREPESIPYIQSMEKMMKSSAMRYKSYDGVTEPPAKEDAHTKISQRSKSYPKHDETSKVERDYNNYNRGRPEYAGSASSGITGKDRFKDTKEKFRGIERTGSRFDLTDERDGSDYNRPRRRGSVEPIDTTRVYDDWSDEERLVHADSPPLPPVNRSRSRSRDPLWEQSAMPPMRERDMLPPREQHKRERDARDPRDHRDYPREMRGPREPLVKQHSDHRDMREHTRDVREAYRPRPREQSREVPRDREHVVSERHRDQSIDGYVRERARRAYSPDMHSGGGGRRPHEKQADMYPSPTPPPSGAPMPNTKSISNLTKGYRHSYAEPVFARSGGRVGLAAVNPF